MTPKALISETLARFLESGLAIAVATRDDDLQPDGAWAWAARVDPDRTHVTLFLYETSAAAMLRNLDRHPEIAAVLDEPTTHRACQVKGLFIGSRRAEAGERPEIERQVAGFRSLLGTIGIEAPMTAEWKVWPSLALRFRVTEVFEQTPGPGTGEPLRGELVTPDRRGA